MKKYVLISCLFALFISCNEQNELVEKTAFEEPEYLLSKIITQYNNEELAGDEMLYYTYDENNNPTFMHHKNTNGDVKLLIEFVYNENHELLEIISHIGNNSFEKAIVQSLNEYEAHFIVQSYNNDILIDENVYEVKLEFDGYLIKYVSQIPTNSNGIYSEFAHDDNGKLLNITNSTIGFTPNTYDVISWDDNAIPDNVSIFSRSLFEVKYWFPKHYISTKNPTKVYFNNESYFIPVTYEYNNINGTVLNYNVSDDYSGPNYFDYSVNFSKEYINAN